MADIWPRWPWGGSPGLWVRSLDQPNLQVLKGTEGASGSALSADQQLVAFNRTDQNNDLWIADLVRRTTTRLTFDAGIDDFPVWSPDGARIVFSSNREGGVFNLFEKPSGGGGQEQLLLKTSQPKMATDWSRDGRYIVYDETDATSGADIWLLPLSGDRKPNRIPANTVQRNPGARLTGWAMARLSLR